MLENSRAKNRLEGFVYSYCASEMKRAVTCIGKQQYHQEPKVIFLMHVWEDWFCLVQYRPCLLYKLRNRFSHAYVMFISLILLLCCSSLSLRLDVSCYETWQSPDKWLVSNIVWTRNEVQAGRHSRRRCWGIIGRWSWLMLILILMLMKMEWWLLCGKDGCHDWEEQAQWLFVIGT